THATGHLLALENSGRSGAGADGSGLAVHAMRAVAGGSAAEAVALHHTGETLALGHRGDVDEVTGGEHVGADRLADLVVRDVFEAKLDEGLTRLDAGGGEMAGLGHRQLVGIAVAEGDLQGVVP